MRMRILSVDSVCCATAAPQQQHRTLHTHLPPPILVPAVDGISRGAARQRQRAAVVTARRAQARGRQRFDRPCHAIVIQQLRSHGSGSGSSRDVSREGAWADGAEGGQAHGSGPSGRAGCSPTSPPLTHLVVLDVDKTDGVLVHHHLHHLCGPPGAFEAFIRGVARHLQQTGTPRGRRRRQRKAVRRGEESPADRSRHPRWPQASRELDGTGLGAAWAINARATALTSTLAPAMNFIGACQLHSD